MRLFFALELSPVIAAAADVAVAPLRMAEPDLAWVGAEKMHLTMKFLGDVQGDHAPLVAAADTVAARHRPFEMQLGGIGAFPNFRRARVVWLGVDPEPRLELLHHDLEIACAERGYDVEGRAFRPHITLARVRTPLALERAKPFARAARRVEFAVRADVSFLTLFESTPGSGASYRRLHAAALGGG